VEALARSNAMHKAKLRDSHIQDAYDADDLGGIHIKPPLSYLAYYSLLENGMIVKHVDVHKEEKQSRFLISSMNEILRNQTSQCLLAKSGQSCSVQGVRKHARYAVRSHNFFLLLTYNLYSHSL
jgi:hypothetical protein